GCSGDPSMPATTATNATPATSAHTAGSLRRAMLGPGPAVRCACSVEATAAESSSGPAGRFFPGGNRPFFLNVMNYGPWGREAPIVGTLGLPRREPGKNGSPVFDRTLDRSREARGPYPSTRRRQGGSMRRQLFALVVSVGMVLAMAAAGYAASPSSGSVGP